MTDKKNGISVTGIFIGVLLLSGFAIAIFVTAVVFLFINALALFGPDGDMTSVWHWTWFGICFVTVCINIYNIKR
jgi:hypothetical protein